MAKLGVRSKENLATCHWKWQMIVRFAIKIYDFSVTCGWRGEEAQNKAFADGNSQKQWAGSKHNHLNKHREPESLGIDLDPYPVDYNNIHRYYFLAGIIFTIAFIYRIDIRWGGEWKDYGHFELME